jgi:hypothetical protein
MVFGAALATLPDWDLISHAFAGVQDTMAGHRGASHSLIAAVTVGAVIGVALGSRWWGRWQTALWAILTIASHAFLDLFNVQGKVGLLLALGPTSSPRSPCSSSSSLVCSARGAADSKGHPRADLGGGHFLPVSCVCLLAPSQGMAGATRS